MAETVLTNGYYCPKCGGHLMLKNLDVLQCDECRIAYSIEYLENNHQ